MKSLKQIIIDDIDGWGENKSNNEENNVISNQDISEVYGDIHIVAFPSYLIHTFHQLRTLQLISFKGADVVFKIDSSKYCRKLATTTTQNNQQPKKLLPHLKDIELIGMKSSSFLNITSITLELCDHIKCLFSPLMAKLLSNLTSIKISRCDAMEEVVSNIDDECGEMAKCISSHTNTTCFPCLDNLDLQDLPCLKHIDAVSNNCGGRKLTSTITASSVYDKFQGERLLVV